MSRRHPNMLLVVAFALIASSAAAQAVNPKRDSTPSRLDSVLPTLDLAGRQPTLVLRNTQAGALRAAGIARTSMDRRLGPGGAEGSFGFLCGLQAGATDQGAAAARGYDPQGRFVGAKLKFTF